MHRPGERIYQIVNGAPAPRRKGGEAKRKIDRELHGVATMVRVRGEGGRVPQQFAWWFYDLRAKRNKVYGGLLRFIDIAVMAGTSREILLKIPEWLTAYINDAFDWQEPDKAPPVRLDTNSAA